MLNNYCCDSMFNAVTKGWINEVVLRPDGSKGSRWFHIEAVEKVKTKNILGFMETDEVTTHDLLMKYCTFCGKEL